MIKFFLITTLGFGMLWVVQFVPIMATYQDIVVNGKIVKRGKGPSCAVRFEAIKENVLNDLKQLGRKIRVLDIGADCGYFSFRIASEYNAHCTIIEGRSHIKNLVKLNNKTNGIFLINRRISADDLIKMSKEQRYDLVLALNVVHHFGEQWRMVINALSELGKFVVIETPPNGPNHGTINSQICGAIDDYLRFERKCHIICTVPRWNTPGLFENVYLLK